MNKEGARIPNPTGIRILEGAEIVISANMFQLFPRVTLKKSSLVCYPHRDVIVSHIFMYDIVWYDVNARKTLANIRWSRSNENRVFRCIWRHRRLLVTEMIMAEYGEDRSNSSRQGVLSSLLRCHLSSSTSLCLQHKPYSAIFISVTRGRRWHQRHRKTRFPFGSTSPYVI